MAKLSISTCFHPISQAELQELVDGPIPPGAEVRQLQVGVRGEYPWCKGDAVAPVQQHLATQIADVLIKDFFPALKQHHSFGSPDEDVNVQMHHTGLALPGVQRLDDRLVFDDGVLDVMVTTGLTEDVPPEQVIWLQRWKIAERMANGLVAIIDRYVAEREPCTQVAILKAADGRIHAEVVEGGLVGNA